MSLKWFIVWKKLKLKLIFIKNIPLIVILPKIDLKYKLTSSLSVVTMVLNIIIVQCIVLFFTIPYKIEISGKSVKIPILQHIEIIYVASNPLTSIYLSLI